MKANTPLGSEYDPSGKQREGILSVMSTSQKGSEQTSQTPKALFLSATPVKSVKNARLLRGFPFLTLLKSVMF